MREDFLANKEKALYKILSADQLIAQQSINQSLLPTLSARHAVLYFCTIPPDVILNGTELEVRHFKQSC
jgi:hypothetical protein